jgi:hypothetical protein
MGMVFFSLLMVVDQFNVKGVCPFKAEDDAPVRPYGDGPKPFQVAFERMQPIPGDVESLWCGGRIENRKNTLNRIQEVATYPAAIPTLIKSFKATVLEAPNHKNTP